MSNTSLLGSYGAQDNSSLLFRNKVINGDMRIDQRNSGASSSPADETYTLDRWSVRKVGAGNFSIQQRTTQSGAANFEAGSAPGGFTHSIKVTTTTQDTVMDAGDVYALAQAFEGLNVGDLGWGTASAQTITVSFWVKSSFAGVYGLALSNPLTDAGYSVLYTINSANTWEYKTIIIPGPTSGTFKTDNTACFRVAWSLGCGSARLTTPNSWVAANSVGATGQGNFMGQSVGATFHLTGVQLEAGPTATPFERRPYSVELGMAKRYYETGFIVIGAYGLAGMNHFSAYNFSAEKRLAVPNVSVFSSFSTNVTSRGTPDKLATGFSVTCAIAGTGFFQQNLYWTAEAEL